MMKKYITLLSIISFLAITGCSDDVLDRPQKDQVTDPQYWQKENDLRLYATGFYTNYFVGYNSGWGTAYAPLRGYTFHDDASISGTQSSFESNIPAIRSSVSETPAMLTQYSGPSWNFSWVRKSNIFLDRIEKVTKPNLTTEAYNHWTAIAKFFRGFEYCRLVSVFGDVPYYDRVVPATELDELYKDRTPRNEVMDKVYDDFKYVLENIRKDDGLLFVDKNIAAAFISRLMLFEGTWQKYHKNDNERAKKFLEFARDAAAVVMESNEYSFSSTFKDLFGSEDLKGNKEVILYRAYDAALSITHQIASYSNGNESQSPAPNLALAKSFICTDAKVYNESDLTDVKKLDLQSMLKTRDSRFEATFYNQPLQASSTLLYASKFISREGVTYIGKTPPARYGSNTNTNDAPVMRYAEVVLNWIEAKAELATLSGGTAVTQSDLDKSINAIRTRPLDSDAIARGVKKTDPLKLTALPNDPARDTDVPALIWEIRRERRMEFVFEELRLLDIRRWKKLNYMNADVNPDILKGLWIDIPNELPALFTAGNKNVLTVEKADGSKVVYDGTNKASMVGFYIVSKAKNRNAFDDRVYLSPVGLDQVNAYKNKGYTLTQSPIWN